MSLPAVTARLYSSDEVQYFSYLRSLYFDQDVSFENEYRYFSEQNIAQSPGFHETFLQRETAVGRRVNYATLGAAVLWAPFFAVADLWTRVTDAAEANGLTMPYIRAVAYGSAFYGFAAVLLSIRAARKIFGSERSAIAGVAVWFGTPLLFYMYVAPPFSHAPSAFAAALFVNVWLYARQTWSARRAFAVGATAALLGLVREQDVFLALGPAVDFLVSRPSVKAALIGTAGFVAGYVPQLLAYNALNGYPGPAEHVSRKMYWYAPHGLQVLASPHHGFLFWTPLALLAVTGLAWTAFGGARRKAIDDAVAHSDVRRVAVCLLLMVASQVYVAGSVESWTVAGAFGQRRFVCLTVVLTIGLAGLLQAVGGILRVGAIVAIALSVWWNVALMAQFATHLMDRQRLEPGRNAYHAFVTLPRDLPALAYRYLTDRESFYARPVTGPR